MLVISHKPIKYNHGFIKLILEDIQLRQWNDDACLKKIPTIHHDRRGQQYWAMASLALTCDGIQVGGEPASCQELSPSSKLGYMCLIVRKLNCTNVTRATNVLVMLKSITYHSQAKSITMFSCILLLWHFYILYMYEHVHKLPNPWLNFNKIFRIHLAVVVMFSLEGYYYKELPCVVGR